MAVEVDECTRCNRAAFNALWVVHVLMWVFVLAAAIWVPTAYLNLYFVIPAIYLLHLLPGHILIEQKKRVCPKVMLLGEGGAPKVTPLQLFMNARRALQDNCMNSPLTPQGMLLFGAITCAWRLRCSDFRC